MAVITKVGQLRAPVATYTSLPITDNVLGDLRIVFDTGDAFVWLISATSGGRENWGRVTTSSYAALVGGPFSTAFDIDNAVKTIKALAINTSLLAYDMALDLATSVDKMFDGVVNRFRVNQLGIDTVQSLHEVWSTDHYYPDNLSETLPSSPFTDSSSSPHTVTGSGAAAMKGTNPLFGNASLYLDGTANTYLSSPNHADYSFDTIIPSEIDSYVKLMLHLDAFWSVKVSTTTGSDGGDALEAFNGKLYCSTDLGKLYEWNGTNAWVEKAASYDGQVCIDLQVFNGKLYGITYQTCRLLEWNGTNAWVLKADQFGSGINGWTLGVHNSKLYGGTRQGGGYLLEWNGTNSWVQKAAPLNSEAIASITSFGGSLYAGTFFGGKLYQWNGTNAWTEVAPILAGSSANFIEALVVFNSKLYGADGNTGKLLEWNGTNAWIEKAPGFSGWLQCHDLTVYNGELYGCSENQGKLAKWNGTNAWIQIAPLAGSSSNIIRLAQLNSKIYGLGVLGGTKDLLEWPGNAFIDSSSSAKTCVANGDATITTSQSKFGGASAAFDGSGDYISVADSADWDFSAGGDWTVDFWLKCNTIAGNQGIWGQRTASDQITMHTQDSGRLYFFIRRADQVLIVSTYTDQNVLIVGQWQHIAVVHTSTHYKVFVNGVLLINSSSGSILPSNYTGPLTIGHAYDAGVPVYLNGYIDEFRVSNGIARWTSNFTPPTSAYTTGSQTFNDYSIDLWIDPVSLADLNTYVIGVTDSWKLTFDGTSNKYLKYTIVGGASVTAPITILTNTWTHVAVVQSAGTVKLYINGVLGGSVAGTAMTDTATALTIGGTSAGANLFQGYIEEVRISNSARWTANFVPTIIEYSNDANTKLLLHLNKQTVLNMTLQSVGYVANYVPTSARVVVFQEDVDVVEPNVDLTAEVSRDGGATFTRVILTEDKEFGTGTLNLFSGVVDLTAQPNGSLMVYRLKTQNNKNTKIRGVSLNWR